MDANKAAPDSRAERSADRRRRPFRQSATWLLVVLAASIFAAELSIMLVLGAMPELPTLAEAMLDSTLLVVLVFPAFYCLVFRPLKLAIRERGQAEATARRRLEEVSRVHDQLETVHEEFKKAHEQLLQSEKMASIGQLSAGIVHEINNPVGFVSSNLGSLRTYVERLLALIDAYAAGEQGAAGDPQARQRIAEAKAAADLDYLREDIGDLLAESQAGLERVRRIVQDVKRLAHPGQADFQQADLNACLESALNVVWNELKYKAEVVRDLGPIPPVRCIVDQISQVAVNLLVNAAHAIETRGTVAVTTRQEGDWVVLEVSDTGKGMPPEVRKRIFEPFFTTKPVGQGTGLGLSISWKIVEGHAGTIDVQSEPGAGTTFRIRLPVDGPPAAAPGSKAHQAAPAGA